MDLKSLAQQVKLAFTRGAIAEVAGRKMRIAVVSAGTLHLPSGQIVACDPLVGQERKPFIQTVLPGSYAVDLSLGYNTADDIERILFARIAITKNEPVAWIRALRAGEAAVPPQDENAFGFGSSSGTAAFMDKETAEHFLLDSIDDVDQLLDSLVANYRPQRNWLNHEVDGRHNVIMFSAGRGTGKYPSYLAIDDAGDVCLALTQLL